MHLEFPLTHYTILQTHNIAWRKFRSLFLNIVKKGKGAETQNCPNNSVSHNFCHWLSEKSAKFDVQYFRVAQFESNWRHAFTHYVTIMSALIYFASETKVRRNCLDQKFVSFFWWIEICGRLTQFSVTNLLSIYNYVCDKWVNHWNF